MKIKRKYLLSKYINSAKRKIKRLVKKMVTGHARPTRTREIMLDYFDWRNEGAVTAVKDQGRCGSCWSYPIVGALEAFIKITTGILVELSVKYLVDCSDYAEHHRKTSDNCDRYNDIFTATEFVKREGICTEKKYPSKPVSGKCKENISRMKVAFERAMLIDGGEEEMKKALIVHGPLIAHIYFDEWFGLYKDNIYYEDTQRGKLTYHYVLIIGYGYDPRHDLPYWIIKNSWGTTWGEGGYMKMIRGVNQCNISNLVYAIV